MLLKLLERQTLADRQAAASLKAAGWDVELPSLHEKRAQLDASLVAEPKNQQPELDPEQMELRRVLGVA